MPFLIMRARKCQTVGFLFVVGSILIYLIALYRQRIDIHSLQFGRQLRLLSGYTHTKNLTKHDVTSGFPEDYQIPNDAELSGLNQSALMKIYWRYINMLQILCKEVIRVGSLKDGGKEICVDKGYKPTSPCLVYSFGINNQYDFDHAVVKFFGCDVHCFDPSMEDDTHQVSKHIWFYKWGLGGMNHINKKKWTIKTLDTIRQELGHTNTTIDLLKIDIEGDEWNAIPQMITSGALSDVRQISMETHFAKSVRNKKYYWGNVEPHKQLSALRKLYDYGYRIFMRERNLYEHRKLPGSNVSVTSVNEISMIKPII